MQRNQNENLRQWWHSKRRKPLLLRGARQVGKSTLVRQFAISEKLKLVELNLEKFPQLDSIFKSLDMPHILQTIESVLRTSIDLSGKTLLFLDEIQATPNAIASLRYFYEEIPQLPVIAAGSLLEFVLKDHDFSMPVGRIEYLYLGPMLFEEFLEAQGEQYLLEKLKTFTLDDPYHEETHKQLLRKFQLYSIVGGMPEAVLSYIESNDIAAARRIHNSINDTFKDDFAKYGLKQDLARLHLVYDWTARNLGRKVKYSEILPLEQSRTVKRLIDLLSHAQVVKCVFHSAGNGLSLGAELKTKIFKLLFLDIGLVNSLLETPLHQLSAESLLAIHQGKIAEQMVGQTLLGILMKRNATDLCYWLREGKSSNAEVDFLMPIHGRVVPIEVKAGEAGVLKSLNQFVLEKKSPIAVRIDVNMPSVCAFARSSKLLSIPHYAVGELERLVDKHLTIPG